MVADWVRQHPNSNEELRDPVIYDNQGDWNQDTRWSLRNQTDLETGNSQRRGEVNLQKKDDDTNARIGVSASMNDQRRGNESLRTLSGGYTGTGEQETHFGKVTAQSSGSVTRGPNGPSWRAQSSMGLKREDASGAEWAGNLTGRVSGDGGHAVQGSLQRSAELEGMKIQEQLSVGPNGVRASRAKNNFGQNVETEQLDSGFTRRRESNRFGSRMGIDLGSDLSLDGSLSGSRQQTTWNRDNISAGSSFLKGNIQGRLKDRETTLDAQGSLWEGNASIRKRRRHAFFDEDFETTGTLSGTADIGGRAKAKADFSNGVNAEVDGFLGAKAEASLKGELEWDRQDDYSDLLRDHFDNFPGTWDDRLVDKIPDKALQRAGQVLFGKGKTKLASGSVGVDARAGVGANASASAQMNEGFLELGASVGSAVGLGGGVSARGGVNPVAIGRLGVLKGMEGVNRGYDGAEQLTQNVRERAASDTALVGQEIEKTAKGKGPLSRLARMLLWADRKARGLDKK